jgi:hypothetical protein
MTLALIPCADVAASEVAEAVADMKKAQRFGFYSDEHKKIILTS